MKLATPFDRRRLLQLSLGVAATYGLAPAATSAVSTPDSVPLRVPASGNGVARSRTTFVLVHGAWHGGWCWARVAPQLAAEGHRVLTPTLTGLGASRHLLGPDIGLGTHVDDVVGLVEAEEPGPIVLVGHSYGGMVAAGAADRLRSQVQLMVLLDTAIPQDRRSLAETVGVDPEVFRAGATLGGVALPVPPLSAFGVPEDHAEAAWLRRRLTPHPVATFLEPIAFHQGGFDGLDVHYIRCTSPALPMTATFAAQARARGYPVHELASGHDAMVTAPGALAGTLVGIADPAA